MNIFGGVAVNKKRIGYVDLYKGIGIMLMIFGHVSFWGTLDHLIHAFNMPMFFLASGLFYSKKSREELTFTSFFVKKSKSLLVPYFVFGIINYLAFVMFNGFDINPLFHLIWQNNHDVAIAGALWFITALLIAESIYFLIDRYCNYATRIAIIFILAVIGSTASLFLPFILPWTMSAAFVGVLFFYVGILVRENAERLFSIKWYLALTAALIDVVLIYVNGELNMRNEVYAIIPLSIFNAVVASVLLLYFCQKAEGLLCDGMICRWLKDVGKNSIVYLVLNQLVILVSFRILEMFSLNKHISKIVCFIMSLIVLYFLEKLLTRTKLRVLIGRGL